MRITNKTGFAIIAFGWHKTRGYGEDVRISPGAIVEVNGPHLGEMGGGSCHVAIGGTLTCHEDLDNDIAMQVLKGEPLVLGMGDLGITVRHHADLPEDCVLDWRQEERLKL
jgi:hypothetical protein